MNEQSSIPSPMVPSPKGGVSPASGNIQATPWKKKSFWSPRTRFEFIRDPKTNDLKVQKVSQGVIDRLFFRKKVVETKDLGQIELNVFQEKKTELAWLVQEHELLDEVIQQISEKLDEIRKSANPTPKPSTGSPSPKPSTGSPSPPIDIISTPHTSPDIQARLEAERKKAERDIAIAKHEEELAKARAAKDEIMARKAMVESQIGALLDEVGLVAKDIEALLPEHRTDSVFGSLLERIGDTVATAFARLNEELNDLGVTRDEFAKIVKREMEGIGSIPEVRQTILAGNLEYDKAKEIAPRLTAFSPRIQEEWNQALTAWKQQVMGVTSPALAKKKTEELKALMDGVAAVCREEVKSGRQEALRHFSGELGRVDISTSVRGGEHQKGFDSLREQLVRLRGDALRDFNQAIDTLGSDLEAIAKTRDERIRKEETLDRAILSVWAESPKPSAFEQYRARLFSWADKVLPAPSLPRYMEEITNYNDVITGYLNVCAAKDVSGGNVDKKAGNLNEVRSLLLQCRQANVNVFKHSLESAYPMAFEEVPDYMGISQHAKEVMQQLESRVTKHLTFDESSGVIAAQWKAEKEAVEKDLETLRALHQLAVLRDQYRFFLDEARLKVEKLTGPEKVAGATMLDNVSALLQRMNNTKNFEIGEEAKPIDPSSVAYIESRVKQVVAPLERLVASSEQRVDIRDKINTICTSYENFVAEAEGYIDLLSTEEAKQEARAAVQMFRQSMAKVAEVDELEMVEVAPIFPMITAIEHVEAMLAEVTAPLQAVVVEGRKLVEDDVVLRNEVKELVRTHQDILDESIPLIIQVENSELARQYFNEVDVKLKEIRAKWDAKKGGLLRRDEVIQLERDLRRLSDPLNKLIQAEKDRLDALKDTRTRLEDLLAKYQQKLEAAEASIAKLHPKEQEKCQSRREAFRRELDALQALIKQTEPIDPQVLKSKGIGLEVLQDSVARVIQEQEVISAERASRRATLNVKRQALVDEVTRLKAKSEEFGIGHQAAWQRSLEGYEATLAEIDNIDEFEMFPLLVPATNVSAIKTAVVGWKAVAALAAVATVVPVLYYFLPAANAAAAAAGAAGATPVSVTPLAAAGSDIAVGVFQSMVVPVLSAGTNLAAAGLTNMTSSVASTIGSATGLGSLESLTAARMIPGAMLAIGTAGHRVLSAFRGKSGAVSPEGKPVRTLRSLFETPLAPFRELSVQEKGYESNKESLKREYGLFEIELARVDRIIDGIEDRGTKPEFVAANKAHDKFAGVLSRVKMALELASNSDSAARIPLKAAQCQEFKSELTAELAILKTEVDKLNKKSVERQKIRNAVNLISDGYHATADSLREKIERSAGEEKEKLVEALDKYEAVLRDMAEIDEFDESPLPEVVPTAAAAKPKKVWASRLKMIKNATYTVAAVAAAAAAGMGYLYLTGGSETFTATVGELASSETAQAVVNVAQAAIGQVGAVGAYASHVYSNMTQACANIWNSPERLEGALTNLGYAGGAVVGIAGARVAIKRLAGWVNRGKPMKVREKAAYLLAEAAAPMKKLLKVENEKEAIRNKISRLITGFDYQSEAELRLGAELPMPTTGFNLQVGMKENEVKQVEKSKLQLALPEVTRNLETLKRNAAALMKGAYVKVEDESDLAEPIEPPVEKKKVSSMFSGLWGSTGVEDLTENGSMRKTDPMTVWVDFEALTVDQLNAHLSFVKKKLAVYEAALKKELAASNVLTELKKFNGEVAKAEKYATELTSGEESPADAKVSHLQFSTAHGILQGNERKKTKGLEAIKQSVFPSPEGLFAVASARSYDEVIRALQQGTSSVATLVKDSKRYEALDLLVQIDELEGNRPAQRRVKEAYLRIVASEAKAHQANVAAKLGGIGAQSASVQGVVTERLALTKQTLLDGVTQKAYLKAHRQEWDSTYDEIVTDGDFLPGNLDLVTREDLSAYRLAVQRVISVEKETLTLIDHEQKRAVKADTTWEQKIAAANLALDDFTARDQLLAKLILERSTKVASTNMEALKLKGPELNARDIKVLEDFRAGITPEEPSRLNTVRNRALIAGAVIIAAGLAYDLYHPGPEGELFPFTSQLIGNASAHVGQVASSVAAAAQQVWSNGSMENVATMVREAGESSGTRGSAFLSAFRDNLLFAPTQLGNAVSAIVSDPYMVIKALKEVPIDTARSLGEGALQLMGHLADSWQTGASYAFTGVVGVGGGAQLLKAGGDTVSAMSKGGKALMRLVGLTRAVGKGKPEKMTDKEIEEELNRLPVEIVVNALSAYTKFVGTYVRDVEAGLSAARKQSSLSVAEQLKILSGPEWKGDDVDAVKEALQKISLDKAREGLASCNDRLTKQESALKEVGAIYMSEDSPLYVAMERTIADQLRENEKFERQYIVSVGWRGIFDSNVTWGDWWSGKQAKLVDMLGPDEMTRYQKALAVREKAVKEVVDKHPLKALAESHQKYIDIVRQVKDAAKLMRRGDLTKDGQLVTAFELDKAVKEIVAEKEDELDVQKVSDVVALKKVSDRLTGYARRLEDIKAKYELQARKGKSYYDQFISLTKPTAASAKKGVRTDKDAIRDELQSKIAARVRAELASQISVLDKAEENLNSLKDLVSLPEVWGTRVSDTIDQLREKYDSERVFTLPSGACKAINDLSHEELETLGGNPVDLLGKIVKADLDQLDLVSGIKLKDGAYAAYAKALKTAEVQVDAFTRKGQFTHAEDLSEIIDRVDGEIKAERQRVTEAYEAKGRTRAFAFSGSGAQQKVLEDGLKTLSNKIDAASLKLSAAVTTAKAKGNLSRLDQLKAFESEPASKRAWLISKLALADDKEIVDKQKELGQHLVTLGEVSDLLGLKVFDFFKEKIQSAKVNFDNYKEKFQRYGGEDRPVAGTKAVTASTLGRDLRKLVSDADSFHRTLSPIELRKREYDKMKQKLNEAIAAAEANGDEVTARKIEAICTALDADLKRITADAIDADNDALLQLDAISTAWLKFMQNTYREVDTLTRASLSIEGTATTAGTTLEQMSQRKDATQRHLGVLARELDGYTALVAKVEERYREFVSKLPEAIGSIPPEWHKFAENSILCIRKEVDFLSKGLNLTVQVTKPDGSITEKQFWKLVDDLDPLTLPIYEERVNALRSKLLELVGGKFRLKDIHQLRKLEILLGKGSDWLTTMNSSRATGASGVTKLFSILKAVVKLVSAGVDNLETTFDPTLFVENMQFLVNSLDEGNKNAGEVANPWIELYQEPAADRIEELRDMIVGGRVQTERVPVAGGEVKVVRRCLGGYLWEAAKQGMSPTDTTDPRGRGFKHPINEVLRQWREDFEKEVGRLRDELPADDARLVASEGKLALAGRLLGIRPGGDYAIGEVPAELLREQGVADVVGDDPIPLNQLNTFDRIMAYQQIVYKLVFEVSESDRESGFAIAEDLTVPALKADVHRSDVKENIERCNESLVELRGSLTVLPRLFSDEIREAVLAALKRKLDNAQARIDRAWDHLAHGSSMKAEGLQALRTKLDADVNAFDQMYQDLKAVTQTLERGLPELKALHAVIADAAASVQAKTIAQAKIGQIAATVERTVAEHQADVSPIWINDLVGDVERIARSRVGGVADVKGQLREVEWLRERLVRLAPQLTFIATDMQGQMTRKLEELTGGISNRFAAAERLLVNEGNPAAATAALNAAQVEIARVRELLDRIERTPPATGITQRLYEIFNTASGMIREAGGSEARAAEPHVRIRNEIWQRVMSIIRTKMGVDILQELITLSDDITKQVKPLGHQQAIDNLYREGVEQNRSKLHEALARVAEGPVKDLLTRALAPIYANVDQIADRLLAEDAKFNAGASEEAALTEIGRNIERIRAQKEAVDADMLVVNTQVPKIIEYYDLLERAFPHDDARFAAIMRRIPVEVPAAPGAQARALLTTMHTAFAAQVQLVNDWRTMANKTLPDVEKKLGIIREPLALLRAGFPPDFLTESVKNSIFDEMEQSLLAATRDVTALLAKFRDENQVPDPVLFDEAQRFCTKVTSTVLLDGGVNALPIAFFDLGKKWSRLAEGLSKLTLPSDRDATIARIRAVIAGGNAGKPLVEKFRLLNEALDDVMINLPRYVQLPPE